MSVDLGRRSSRGQEASSTERLPVARVPEAVPPPPRLPGRRHPRWVALGVLALCLGGLLSWVLYARLADQVTVVAVSRTIYRGELMGRADLRTVSVPQSLAQTSVRAEDLDSLVGRRAGLDLVSGAPVSRLALEAGELPASGRAVVGLKVASGRAPEALLPPGAPVRLVALPAGTADTGAPDELSGKTYVARVVGHAPGADGTSLLVDLDVEAQQAPVIARLGAAERLAVVRDAGR